MDTNIGQMKKYPKNWMPNYFHLAVIYEKIYMIKKYVICEL